MTKRNRKTLTGNFAAGKLPTQEVFADLIDSMVNIVDDGFDKSALDGMKVAQIGNNSKLISFYDEITVKVPLWSLGFTIPSYGGLAGGKNLSLYAGDNSKAGITITRAPVADSSDELDAGRVRVGVNQPEPQGEFDVGGTIVADGRVGREGSVERLVRADGKWHPILTDLDGCQAYEVMAGVGKRQSGRYALLHAFVLSTFNSKKSSINYHQAHYASRCDQIELRWTGQAHQYALEMRTRCSYEQSSSDEIYVRYYLTQLWMDPFMDGCVRTNGIAPGAKG